MIGSLETISTYISGLYTLPWILVGYIVTLILSHYYGEEKINRIMKKIGLILLYVFVPLLLFRIFFNVDFNENEIVFTLVVIAILASMYVLAYLFAIYKTKKIDIKDKRQFITTMLTNQGRSSAFIGGAMLAINSWSILAAIYMSIGAIFLFAIIPYFLSYLHNKDVNNTNEKNKVNALPWYLKIFPWYLLAFVFSSIIVHGTTGIHIQDFGDAGIVFTFFTALTIPAALYYVGAGIHPNDLKKNELKKLFTFIPEITKDHLWLQVRNIFLLTVVLTPILTALIIIPLFILGYFPETWFSVLFINSFLPITSTNMFLIPYGINRKVTALSVTWTTIICVPIVVALIAFLSLIY